jgi:uncharacterized protein (TIGR02270 family)
MPHLLRAVRERSPFAERALRLALPALAAAERKSLPADLAALPASQPLAVIGMGAGGDPGAVPLLLDLMSKPKLARLAGEAFSMITGADLAYLDLDQDPPPGGDEAEEKALTLGYESNLPWLSPERVARWWGENGKRLSPGTRHLRGARIDRASCLATLAQGTQRQRAAAALELALLDPTAPLFEVRARGSRQEQQLQQLARGQAWCSPHGQLPAAELPVAAARGFGPARVGLSPPTWVSDGHRSILHLYSAVVPSWHASQRWRRSRWH